MFHVRLLPSTSTSEPDSDEVRWSNWLLPGCTARSACNATLLVCLSHAQTSSIPSSSSSSSSSSVQPLCLTPTPGRSDPRSDLVVRFPIEFTWPVRGFQSLLIRARLRANLHLSETPTLVQETSRSVKQWLRLRFDFGSTANRRRTTIEWPSNRSRMVIVTATLVSCRRV